MESTSGRLGLLPPPTEPRPAGVRSILILPEAGKPAAGWGRVGEGGWGHECRLLCPLPVPPPAPARLRASSTRYAGEATMWHCRRTPSLLECGKPGLLQCSTYATGAS